MRSGGASAGSRSLGCVMIHFSAAGVSTESSIAVTPSSARAICGAGPAVAPFLRKRSDWHTVHSGGVAEKWFEIHILDLFQMRRNKTAFVRVIGQPGHQTFGPFAP